MSDALTRIHRPDEDLPRARRKPPADGPRPVAVVDCGTSSVRAFLAEIHGAKQRILEDLFYPVDLTPGFTGGNLDHAAMTGVVEAFQAVQKAAAGYGIKDIRAVGTSALREAANSDVLIERLRLATGIELEIIECSEAARLYFEALRLLLEKLKRKLTGDTLMIDIGGGSTVVSLIRDGKLVHTVDEHYGAVRCNELFKSLKDNRDFAITIDRFAFGAARMMMGRLPPMKVANLVVTGGEVRRLVSLVARDQGLMTPLEAAAVDRWFAAMSRLTPMARAEACGTDESGAARLLPAACLIRHLAKVSGAKLVQVPQFTLRDGLLADLLPGAQGPHHLDDGHLIAEAKQLVSRYGGNLSYAENTASLAVQIFDQTMPMHGLGARERSLLHFAALVHDIGSFINVRNRHKHTMYLIQACEIAGLTRIEKEMVAHIARYHRRAAPQAHHAGYQALPRPNRVVVGQLAALLRLAYGLDVERDSRIRKVRCERTRDRLLLRVDRRQIALERWSIAGKAGLFQDVFGLAVEVVPREGE